MIHHQIALISNPASNFFGFGLPPLNIRNNLANIRLICCVCQILRTVLRSLVSSTVHGNGNAWNSVRFVIFCFYSPWLHLFYFEPFKWTLKCLVIIIIFFLLNFISCFTFNYSPYLNFLLSCLRCSVSYICAVPNFYTNGTGTVYSYVCREYRGTYLW
jgi:hypothetical protein